MRTAIMLGSAGLLVATALLYHEGRAATAPAPSQIFIHGTPVCVYRQGGNIVARLGECDGTSERGTRALPPRDIPFHGGQGTALPPGHPPIDGGTVPEAPRRITI